VERVGFEEGDKGGRREAGKYCVCECAHGEGRCECGVRALAWESRRVYLKHECTQACVAN